MEPTPFQTYSAGPRLEQRNPPDGAIPSPSPRREAPVLMGRPQQQRMPHFEMGSPTHSTPAMMPHPPASPSWQQRQHQQDGLGPSGYPPGMAQFPSDPRTRRDSRGDAQPHALTSGGGDGVQHPTSPTRSPRRHPPVLQESGGLEGRLPNQSGHLPGLQMGVHMSGGPPSRVAPRPQPPSSRFAEVGWSPVHGGRDARGHGELPHRLYSFNHWVEPRVSGDASGMPRGRSSGSPDGGFQFTAGHGPQPGVPSPTMPRPSNHQQ